MGSLFSSFFNLILEFYINFDLIWKNDDNIEYIIYLYLILLYIFHKIFKNLKNYHINI